MRKLNSKLAVLARRRSGFRLFLQLINPKLIDGPSVALSRPDANIELVGTSNFRGKSLTDAVYFPVGMISMLETAIFVLHFRRKISLDY
jgi:hypothetical protein